MSFSTVCFQRAVLGCTHLCLLGTEHYFCCRSASIQGLPSFFLTLKGQKVRGKRGPISREGKKEMEPFSPALTAHMCLHLLSEGDRQVVSSLGNLMRKKSQLRINMQHSLQPVLDLSGGGVGLRKRPLVEDLQIESFAEPLLLTDYKLASRAP